MFHIQCLFNIEVVYNLQNILFNQYYDKSFCVHDLYVVTSDLYLHQNYLIGSVSGQLCSSHLDVGYGEELKSTWGSLESRIDCAIVVNVKYLSRSSQAIFTFMSKDQYHLKVKVW